MPVFSKLADFVPPVTTRQAFFKWPMQYIEYAKSQPSYDRLARRLATLTLSTCFTGVCTPSVALEALRLANRCDGTTGLVASTMDFTYLFGIDYDPECRRECRVLPHPPGCIHGAMDAFLADGVLDECVALGDTPDWTELCDIIWRPGNVRLASTSCDIHNGCSCALRAAMIHVAGVPCTDFSSQGKQRRCSGPSMRCTLIWARHRTLLCEPIVIVENVCNFDHVWLQRILPMYKLSFCCMDAKATALPVSRPRKYMVLTFQGWALERPLADVSCIFSREKSDGFTMYDLFIAPQPELDLELDWGYNRRAKKNEVAAQKATNAATISPVSRRSFLNALVQWERTFLNRYVETKGALRVYALQQDPDSSFGSASTLTSLQCVIKASHLMWVDKLKRWMTGRELLLAQGFPVYASLLREMQPWLVSHEHPIAICSFNRSRASIHLPPRSRKQFGSMAGNAMCVPVVAAFMLYSLMHVAQVPSASIPAQIVASNIKHCNAADAFFNSVSDRQKRRRRASSAGELAQSPQSDSCTFSITVSPESSSTRGRGNSSVASSTDASSSRASPVIKHIQQCRADPAMFLARRALDFVDSAAVLPASPASNAFVAVNAAGPCGAVVPVQPKASEADAFFQRVSQLRKKRRA